MKKLLIAALVAGAAAVPASAQSQAPAIQAPRAGPMQANVTHTRDQAATKVRETFARLDSNRDGFVTREEAQAGRAAMRQNRMGAGKAARAPGARTANRAPGARMADRGAMFDRIDSNRDGTISRDEFSRAPAMQRRVAIRGAGQPGMRRMIRARPGMMAMGGRMFELADANRDSRVSLQEATAAAMQRFDTVDTNRDGQVTRDERRQARERMRGQRNRG